MHQILGQRWTLPETQAQTDSPILPQLGASPEGLRKRHTITRHERRSIVWQEEAGHERSKPGQHSTRSRGAGRPVCQTHLLFHNQELRSFHWSVINIK